MLWLVRWGGDGLNVLVTVNGCRAWMFVMGKAGKSSCGVRGVVTAFRLALKMFFMLVPYIRYLVY